MDKYKISLTQVFAMLVGVTIGGGLLNIGSTLSGEAKQDAWIVVLIGGSMILILVNISLSLHKSYPKDDVLQISRNLMGNLIGSGVNIAFIVYFVVLAASSLRISVDFFSAWVLPRTPLEMVSLPLMFIAFYMVKNGLQVVARVSEIILIIMLPFALIIIIPFEKWDILNILPIGQQPILSYLTGTLKSVYSFLGFEILLFIYPYVKANHKKVRFVTNLSIIFVILIYGSLTFAIVASMGVKGTENEIYSTIKYSQLVTLPLIERVGFFLTFFWIFAMFHTLGILYYFAHHTFARMVPEKWQQTGIFLAIPIYFLAFYPRNIAEVGRYSNYVAIVGFTFLAIIIITLKLISLTKKRLS